jgi:FkbM family methyltransferase
MLLPSAATITEALRCSRQGVGIRSKYILLFLTAFGRIGLNRTWLRPAVKYQIGLLGARQFVDVKVRRNQRSLIFSLRRDNEADYLIGSELIKDIYKFPDFEPEQIVDGGANIGLFSIIASSLFPGARIACYEPDRDNFSQLQRNLSLNAITADCYQLGLWSKVTTLYYHARLSHTGFVSEDPSNLAIRCVRPTIGSNCWLKLDVEMAEYEILPALLAAGEYPRWLSMEIHHYDSKGTALTKLLARHGYTMSGCDHKDAKEVTISAWRA